MANATLKATTVVLTGVAGTAASGTIVSSETMTITATTAQSALDFNSLMIYVANANSTASVVLSLGAGANFSEIGQGAKSITIATEATVMIGGQGFESARFLNASGAVVFTQAGAGPTTWLAFQQPRATE
jgi:hypothetical protein